MASFSLSVRFASSIKVEGFRWVYILVKFCLQFRNQRLVLDQCVQGTYWSSLLFFLDHLGKLHLVDFALITSHDFLYIVLIFFKMSERLVMIISYNHNGINSVAFKDWIFFPPLIFSVQSWEEFLESASVLKKKNIFSQISYLSVSFHGTYSLERIFSVLSISKNPKLK